MHLFLSLEKLLQLMIYFHILQSKAESVHYPVSSKKDLLGFLLQADPIKLSQWTFQKDYVPGLGRKEFNRFWTPSVESTMQLFTLLLDNTLKMSIFHSFECSRTVPDTGTV